MLLKSHLNCFVMEGFLTHNKKTNKLLNGSRGFKSFLSSVKDIFSKMRQSFNVIIEKVNFPTSCLDNKKWWRTVLILQGKHVQYEVIYDYICVFLSLKEFEILRFKFCLLHKLLTVIYDYLLHPQVWRNFKFFDSSFCVLNKLLSD